MTTFDAIPLPYAGAVSASLLVILGVTLLFPLNKGNFIIINRHPWDFFQTKAKQKFEYNATALLNEGLQTGCSAFRLVTNMVTYLILKDKYAEEIKNDSRFGAHEAVDPVLLVDLPGFETMFQGSLHNQVPPVAVRALNKELVNLTPFLSEEAMNCLQTRWTDTTEWHDVSIPETVLALIAQMTTRALLGPKLCRDPEWLDIAKSFTTNRAIAVAAVHSWPRFLQPVVHWFLPPCRALRRQIRCAQRILLPALERQRRAYRSNQPTRREFSNLAVIDQYAKGARYDATMAQLRIIAVAFQTTSDFVEKVIARLCKHPDLIQPLRDEMVLAFGESGLQNHSLRKLTLMESVMKESQRLEPAVIIGMFRLAKEKVTLKDGTVVPKGTNIAFANDLRFDPEMYPEPETFDGYRFQRMREDPEKLDLTPLTKTRMSHLAFGHGKHACPGRFLACDEAKLILCHILLSYDIRAVEGSPPELRANGMFVQLDPRAMMSVKRRDNEIALDG
ncbi:cytochrome p450 [Hirsutella rhossiliensis]|uniref:Cytochrome p450 domain-containing protein n=1 Tax=Hirsutella rhossiliensis TaxID=111463 RepID=A0A9P8MUU6_9HYPO|nr:cytochrome p450 domain-containing protein [Hirsutella rhossiliensis]KAH0962533.1 cytochrome p450 domain-containing protein [Hirsutella rhossiliensis]